MSSRSLENLSDKEVIMLLLLVILKESKLNLSVIKREMRHMKKVLDKDCTGETFAQILSSIS